MVPSGKKPRISIHGLIMGVFLGLAQAGFTEKTDAELAQVIADVKHSDPKIRLEAFAKIRHKLGPRAAAAVPTLIELIKTNPYDTDHTQVAKSLAAIGRAAVVELVKLVRTETNTQWRSVAIYTLRSGGGKAPDLAVPALVAAMNDPEPTIRYEALKALATVCAGKSEEALAAIPEITKLLNDRDIIVRHSSAVVLGSMGSAAGSAAPTLVAQLDESDLVSCSVALSTLCSIGPGARMATGKLISILEHPGLREDAAIALRHIGLNGPDDVRALINILEHEQPRSRQLAASLLASAGPDARAAVPLLTASLEDDATREFAIDALGRIGPDSEPAVPHLIGFLTADEYFIRAGAAEALGRIGDSAKAAIPVLEGIATGDTNALARWHAEKALERIRIRNR